MNRRIYDVAIAVVLTAVLALSGYELIQYAFAAPPLTAAYTQCDPSNNGNCWNIAASGNAGFLPYPFNSTPITGNGSGSTGAVVGTLAGVVGKTTYICGFNVSAVGGTAAIGPVTVAGLVGSSQTYQLFSTATGVNFPQNFTPCIPASAANTAITITTTADGTATAVDVNSWGFQL